MAMPLGIVGKAGFLSGCSLHPSAFAMNCRFVSMNSQKNDSENCWQGWSSLDEWMWMSNEETSENCKFPVYQIPTQSASVIFHDVPFSRLVGCGLLPWRVTKYDSEIWWKAFGSVWDDRHRLLLMERLRTRFSTVTWSFFQDSATKSWRLDHAKRVQREKRIGKMIKMGLFCAVCQVVKKSSSA